MNSDPETSQLTTNDSITPSSISADSCPISDLLSQRIETMTEEELVSHVGRIRRAREQPQVLRTLLKGKEKAPAKPKKSKVDLSILFPL